MKKRNGFTLIELLAVIVILAIIAVIAVPIVINIIDESKENATLRSAEMYMDAVEMSVAQATLKGQNIEDKTYNILENGNICLENYQKTEESETCNGLAVDVKNNEKVLEVEVNGEAPKSGTIIIKDGNISNVDFEVSENRVIKNDKGEIIYFPCILVSGEKNEIGSKYLCEVKPGTKYNFYILSYNDANNELTNDKNKAVTTNLIMDSNVIGISPYWSKTASNTGGPVKVMDNLYNATKSWINISNIIINYNDENIKVNGSKGSTGYGAITTTNGITKVINKDGAELNVLDNQLGYINLKSRLPYYSEVENSDGTKEYLYENLYENGPKGYWTLSSVGDNDCFAWGVNYSGVMKRSDAGEGLFILHGFFGIRPVITLNL